MLKLTLSIMAFALAGTASAAGWRSMRIDASSEDSFNESVIQFRQKLPRVRRAVFEQSLQDIWVEGIRAAQADGRDYTVNDYLRDVDGLKYKELIVLTDPTGDTADRYYDQAYATLAAKRAGGAQTPQGTRFGGWNPSNRPREASEPRGPRAGQPGLNPWQQ